LLNFRDKNDSEGGMWNFGSGSYGTEEAKAKIKGEKFHKHSKKKESDDENDGDLNAQK
jgi:hypothetical protein